MEKQRAQLAVASPVATSGQREQAKQRRSRRKVHLAWQQAELMSHGLYGDYFNRIAARYPKLTAMELRIAALVKAQLPSWEIANVLGICEATVENHRVNIRKKIGIESGGLMTHLQAL